MKSNISSLLLVVVAGASLAACGESAKQSQADAVRNTNDAAAASMENQADMTENRGESVGGSTENAAEANADAMRDKADAVRETGEAKADAVEDGTVGATTKTDSMTTTTTPNP